MSKNIASYESCFNEHDSTTLQSAQIIVPLVMELISPESVIDIGCGRGVWLRSFVENGVSHIKGIDSPFIDQTKLYFDPHSFQAVDINQPFDTQESFDLAVCLEVAEHLSLGAGRNLIRVLTRVAPVVLFSAAIPGQTGVGHVNEQWPSYWQALFRKHGFQRVDPFRPVLFNNKSVLWWYRQNICLYASSTAIRGREALKEAAELSSQLELDVIHSSILRRYTTFTGVLSELIPAASRALRQRLP